jgi:signal transduction histidine kinase
MSLSLHTSGYRARLRQRLMLAFTGYTVLVSALFGLFAMAFVYTVEDQFFDSALRQEALAQDISLRAGQGWREPAQDFIRLYRPGQALPEDLARARLREPRSRELSGEQGRHYHLWPLPEQGALLVAEVSGQLIVRPMRRQLLVWLGAWGGGLALLALGLGWWLARRTSAPLARLAQTVAQSQPQQLPTDLAARYGDDEVGLLAAHLAQLNQRTREFIAREQAFSRDASHELRTPLTVLSLACERLAGQGLPPAQSATLNSMRAALWQLQQTVELLLALSRESSPGPSRILGPAEPQALLPQIEQLVLAHAPLLDQQGIELELEVPPTLTRTWPPALTQLLLTNLLGNALAHRQTPQIRISADAQRLSIANASAAPPEALLGTDAAGRQPGLKGEGSAGLGLGLSIVRRLAERHGLRLELQHASGWTTVSLMDAPSEPSALDTGTRTEHTMS